MPVIALILTLFAASWSLDAGLPGKLSSEELKQGRRLFESYCQRCHGSDGDALGYPGVTPLAGLALRLPDGRLDQFRGPSFYAWGRHFPPAEARLLMAHILTLRGEKGYPDPRWVISPYLLNRKLPSRDSYLVLDARPGDVFEMGHIPGAINVPASKLPPGRALALQTAVGAALDSAKVIVLVYDEGPGREAAGVWQKLVRFGYESVAVLDGGFRRWMAEGYQVTRPDVARHPRFQFSPADPGGWKSDDAARLAARHVRVDLGRTVSDSGLADASVLSASYRELGLDKPGVYRVEAPLEDVSFVVLHLRLLGLSVVADFHATGNYVLVADR